MIVLNNIVGRTLIVLEHFLILNIHGSVHLSKLW